MSIMFIVFVVGVMAAALYVVKELTKTSAEFRKDTFALYAAHKIAANALDRATTLPEDRVELRKELLEMVSALDDRVDELEAEVKRLKAVETVA